MKVEPETEGHELELGEPARIDVLGSRIAALDIGGVLEYLDRSLRLGVGGYVCFTNVHATVMGYRDTDFRNVTNGSLLSVADGKPVYWVARFKGARDIGHVPGPDFMLHALRRFPTQGHFFYGSTPEVLAALSEGLRAAIPELNIAGTYSPPFRPLTPDEEASVMREINESGAAFVWVGLGAPKQERWMATTWEQLRPAVLFGVGAAFDFHAGTLSRAPRWIRRLGLEWLYRLLQEPRRLWKRYFVTNTLFLYYLVLRRLGIG